MPARPLSLRQVCKSYDGRQMAAADVDLDIPAGEFVSLLGPSGSGKTTTLMMIAGFQKPTSGQIVLGERQIDRVPPHRRNIGMVFQNYALFPHMTVADNVGFGLKMRGVTAAERTTRVARALDMVSLGGFADRYPAQMSGGQQQRVALARALVFEPDLILLDEPLGALDKNLREQMQVELKRIHRDLGVTMIYVTHDQSEAMTMSDRIAVFNAGRIEQIGTPAEVYFTPKTRFVADFVGDSNILAATAGAGETWQAQGLGLVQLAGAPAAAGERGHIVLRPEMIRLTDAPTADRPPFRVEATVNYGDSVLVIGKVGDTPLRVRVPSRDGAGLRPGDQRGLSWNDADAHVVRDPA
ncbi:ABC transporter ATP-binding protein [Phenylobacterium sp.]|jgi:putative spermidine/putrescine transport system ATP-binding protein|uniref:ABC transporter ATP-binding protein n=1 Tax=Phenylobacterium sp. TaxID=1871053 RepID=UPI003783012B